MAADLAGDAAEILERDYGIDAGEVLSMNVDTVETVTSSSEVKSDGADEILGKNGKVATWGSYTFPHNGQGGGGGEGFNHNNIPPTTSGTISGAWDIADRSVKVKTTDADGNQSIEDSTESVVLFNQPVWAFEFLRNDSEWQDPSEYTEATYKTTIGGDTMLQGTENLNACGEAWWFFKLSEDNKEGYAICYDNHGYDGCGIFTRLWFQMYVCHYDWDNPWTEHIVDPDLDSENPESITVPRPGSYANVKILKKWRVSPFQVCPRYEVTVHEKDGYATITVDPDELNAPYSYIGGEPWRMASDPSRSPGYYAGYVKGDDRSDAALNTDDAFESYRNKENYDWDWPGSTQESVSTTIKLSDTILKKKTTQAFSAFAWNGVYFANNSVDVSKTVTKSFGDIVYEPTWTDGALHMLINMDGAQDRTMLGQDGGRESSTRPS